MRLRRPSALHWPTGARRPFAAAGSGTGGLQPAAPSPQPLPAASVHASLQPAWCCARLPSSTFIERDKEACKGLIGACTRMRCAVCVPCSRAECSGAQCTHSARTVHASTGGRLRAGPSFLAKVDLLIGRWPGWEGGTHLCSRCSSPPCPSYQASFHLSGSSLLFSGTMACVRGAATT